MGSDEMIHFMEDKFAELIEGFIKKYKEEWEDYCYRAFEDVIAEWESHRGI